eukprot:3880277-Amphidinium_carterae.1
MNKTVSTNGSFLVFVRKLLNGIGMHNFLLCSRKLAAEGCKLSNRRESKTPATHNNKEHQNLSQSSS